MKPVWIALMLGFLSSGCGQNGETTRPEPSRSFAYVYHAARRGKIIYDVKYQPATVVFDEPATERALRGVSGDGSTYTLDASQPEVRRLKPGSVLFLYGVALRKVTALQTSGSNIVVSTTQAELTDAISDGQIAWQVPIDFTAGTTSVRPRPRTSSLLNVFAPPVLAAEPAGLKFEGSFLDFDFDVGLVPEGDDRLKLDIDLKTTKLGGAVVELRGDGYVQHLTSIGRLLINKGVLDELDFETRGFNGKVEFTWTAQQQYLPVVVKEMKIRIPGASWELPLVIGGLPFILELSAAVIVHPALTSKGAFSTGEFTISYDANTGFKSTKGGTTGEGGGDSTQEIKHDTSIFGIGPAGFVAALELPRVELALGIMAPHQMADVRSSGSWVDALSSPFFGMGPSPNVKYTKIATMSKLIEELAFPVKPFAYTDLVTSASTMTSGMTGSLPMPGAMVRAPCENAHLVVAANVGVGAKIGFNTPHGLTHALGPLVPHQMTAEPFEAAVNVYKKETVAYKNGVKCLGDR